MFTKRFEEANSLFEKILRESADLIRKDKEALSPGLARTESIKMPLGGSELDAARTNTRANILQTKGEKQ